MSTDVTTGRSVALSDLHLTFPGWRNPRFKTGLDPKDLKEFGTELKHRGLKSPPTVQKIKTPDGFINLLIDGQRRKLGMVAAGFGDDYMVPVVDHIDEILEPTKANFGRLLLDALSMGNNRESISSWELVENAKLLKAENDFSVKSIGQAIGRDSTWVSKMLIAADGAATPLLETWKSGELPDELFRELALLPEKQQTPKMEEVIRLRAEGDKGLARAIAMEAANEVRQARADDPTKPGPKVGAAKERHEAAKEAKAAKAAAKSGKPVPMPKKEADDKPKPPSRAVMEEFVAVLKPRATSDYLKGLLHGGLYALGEKDPKKFEKGWHRMISRIERGPFAPGKDEPAPKKAKKK